MLRERDQESGGGGERWRCKRKEVVERQTAEMYKRRKERGEKGKKMRKRREVEEK